jgi:phosphatidylserine decarboxylase
VSSPAERSVGFAPEGATILIVSGLIVIIAVVISLVVGKEGRLLWIPALAVIWFFLAAQFFRDPPRVAPGGGRLILAPADGKIISIGDAMESPLEPRGVRVSIFMSPFNVHVNRSPVDGAITSFEHKEGRFLGAFKPAASRENEQTIIKMTTPYGPVAFKQIAGFLARRIVFHPKTGDTLKAGDRVGMIRFGSRADVFFPESVDVKVKLGQMVTAGETIIGEFRDAH